MAVKMHIAELQTKLSKEEIHSETDLNPLKKKQIIDAQFRRSHQKVCLA